MSSIPTEYRWRVAVATIHGNLSYRRSAELSKEVIETDPSGTLILKRQQYDSIRIGMSLDDTVAAVGITPCSDEHGERLAWTTMGGSYIRCTLRRKGGEVVSKSFDNVIARSCGIKPAFEECGDPSARPTSKVAEWPLISTEDIAKYFLAHSTHEQRYWYQKVMSGVVKFDRRQVAGRESIEFVFEREEPRFFEFDQENDGPRRNALTSHQINRLWETMLQLGSREALRIRNRLMDAVNQCVNLASSKARSDLLAAVQQGDFLAAESISEHVLTRHRQARIDEAQLNVRLREESTPIYGRDYQNEEEGQLWHYYRVLVFDRDDYRCQYCGIPNDEHDNSSYHVDHIFPVSRGGKTELANLQLLCEPCNLTKGAKTEDEFPEAVRAKWFKNTRPP